MRPNYFDFERYLRPYYECSPCAQLAELICAIPGVVRRWRQRVRGRADLPRRNPASCATSALPRAKRRGNGVSRSGGIDGMDRAGTAG